MDEHELSTASSSSNSTWTIVPVYSTRDDGSKWATLPSISNSERSRLPAVHQSIRCSSEPLRLLRLLRRALRLCLRDWCRRNCCVSDDTCSNQVRIYHAGHQRLHIP